MSVTKSVFEVKPEQVKPGSVDVLDKCGDCGGKLLQDPEGEMICGSCGVVQVNEELPLDISPFNRSPMNHGVIGKNLGTPHKETYQELQQIRLGPRGHRLVQGAISSWDLESIDEPNSIIRNEIMWFTNLALKRGFTDVNVDPLARRFRSSIKALQIEEEKAMRRRLRTRIVLQRSNYEKVVSNEINKVDENNKKLNELEIFLLLRSK